MPRRGYRKGVSDAAQPLLYAVRTNLTRELLEGLQQDAADRGMTHAALVRELIVAHVMRSRLHLPRPNGPSKALIRDLARIGNNLNQLSRQANAGYVSVSAEVLNQVLVELTDTLKRV